MRVRLKNTTLEGQPIAQGGQVFEGNTFVDVVLAMRTGCAFGGHGPLAAYIADACAAAKRLVGVDLVVRGRTAQEQAASFLAQLVMTDLAELVPEEEKPDRQPPKDAGPVPVPAAVLEGLEAVRASGMTNMLDRPVVQKLAVEMGCFETADWIDGHTREYAQGIFRGFHVDESQSAEAERDG